MLTSEAQNAEMQIEFKKTTSLFVLMRNHICKHLGTQLKLTAETRLGK